MGLYTNRTDIDVPILQRKWKRNYLVKMIEADTHLLLQTKVNLFLTTLPALSKPKTAVHVVGIDYEVTGTGNNIKHYAMITLYFVGANPTIEIPEQI